MSLSPQFPRSMPTWQRLIVGSTDDESGCRVWQRGRSVDGYGRIYAAGRSHDAHRLSYLTFVGPVPEGLHLDHLCRNRACCNPQHLEPVTMQENLRRGRIACATAKREVPKAEPLLDPEVVAELIRHRRIADGQRVRKQRLRLNMKQATVAEAAGIQVSSLSRIEAGVYTPRDEHKVTLAAALASEVADLWIPLDIAEAFQRAAA